MADSPLVAGQYCHHVRSTSSPSRSHPAQLRVEEKLQRIRTHMDIASATPEMMQGALRELTDLYESFEELLHLPSNQATCTASMEKKWLEVELSESVKLLDLCSTLKGSLITKKGCIKDLHLALRRRDSAAMESKTIAFIRAAKKTDKLMRNCFRSIKDTKDKCIDKDNSLETASKLFMEVKSITTSLLQLVSSCLSTQSRRQRSSRWSVIAQALGKRKTAGERENEASGFEGLGFFESFESILHKDIDDERMQKIKNQMQSTEILIEGLENGLDGLFKQMIHSRVTLLNILSS